MRLLIVLLCLNISSLSFGQYYYDTIAITKDAYVASGGSANTNFGNSQSLQTYHQYQLQTATVFRTFLEFDLSSIPSNAIIVSAKLKLYNNFQDTTGAQNDIYIEQVDSIWNEGAICWNNQPELISSSQVSIAHSATVGTGWHSYEITDFTQYMLNNSAVNNGIAIRLQNEQSQSTFGLTYNSSDANNNKPEVEIMWMYPRDVSFNVTHSTNGGDDGEVTLAYNAGGTIRTVIIYKIDVDSTATNKAVPTAIASNSSYPSDGLTFSNLEPGLYNTRILDSTYYTHGAKKGMSIDKYFMVGEEGESTRIMFCTYAYHEMASVSNNKRDTTASIAHWNNTNSWDIQNTQIGTSESRYPPQNDTEWQYENKGLIKYPIDFDPSLAFDTAFFAARAYSTFYRHHNSTNDSYYRPISEDWQYKKVTWNSQPLVDSTTYIYIPTTTAIGGDPDKIDTVNLLPLVEYWQENPNYGFQHALANQEQTDFANRSYRRPYSDNQMYLRMDYRVKPQIETTFNDTTYTGDITVNAPAGELPYKYLIANEPIPVLDSLWTNIKDSIAIDSVSFWTGTENSRNYSFENLYSGKYYISVYNNSGDQILNKEVYLNPNTIIVDSLSLGLDISSDTISVDPANQNTSGHAILEGIVHYEDDGAMSMSILNFDGETIFGFNNEEDTLAYTDSEFEFGFEAKKIQGQSKIIILKNNSSVDTISASLGDTLELKKSNKTIRFFKNGTELDNYALSYASKVNYKLEIKKTGVSASSLLHYVHVKFPAKANKIITHTTCGENNGGSVIINPSSFHSYILTSATLTNTSTLSSSTITTFPGEFASLETGSYELETTWSSGGASFTITESTIIEIGYELIWGDPVVMTTYLNNAYHPGAASGFGKVKSTNETAASGSNENWITYRHSSYEAGSSGSIALTNSSNENLVKIHTYEWIWGIKILWITDDLGDIQDISSTAYTTWPVVGGGDAMLLFPGEDPVIKVGSIPSSATINVDFDNEEVASFNFTTSNKAGKIYVNAIGLQTYQSVIASFCNFNLHRTYFELSEKIQPGFYEVPTDDVLRVKYYEEYLDQDDALNFKAVNDAGVDQSLSGEDIMFGDNRLDIDVSSLSSGHYTFVVTNEKNETWYLRFKVQ